VHTELGRSQVEVQRCTLSWEVGKELGAESRRRDLAKSLAKSWQGGSAFQVDADMVEEKLEEEARRRTRRKRTASRGGGGGGGG